MTAPVSALIGATAGVGRAMAEHYAVLGHDLILVASDPRDLNALRQDIELRHGVRVETHQVQFANATTTQFDQLVQALRTCPSLRVLAFPIGLSSPNDGPLTDPKLADDIWMVNFVSVLKLTQAYLHTATCEAPLRVIGFSSIATARGRSGNVVYSAAKRALESYFESLRHAYADTPVRFQLYRLGYAQSQQSFGKKLLFPVKPTSWIAQQIDRDGLNNFGSRYLPSWWWMICTLLRWLPWHIFKRLSF